MREAARGGCGGLRSSGLSGHPSCTLPTSPQKTARRLRNRRPRPMGLRHRASLRHGEQTHRAWRCHRRAPWRRKKIASARKSSREIPNEKHATCDTLNRTHGEGNRGVQRKRLRFYCNYTLITAMKCDRRTKLARRGHNSQYLKTLIASCRTLPASESWVRRRPRSQPESLLTGYGATRTDCFGRG